MTANTRVLMALMLLTVPTAGCEPRSIDTGRPVGCTVVVDTPATTENVDKIVGKVRFRCDNPGAEELTLKMRIERKSGDQWHNVKSQTFTVKGEDTMAPGLKYQSRQVETGCRDGTYRTVVDWSRESRGNTKGDNLISGSMRDPCKPLFQAAAGR